MDRRTTIAIIGAGLGGMTAAGLLQRAGFQVKVFEQTLEFSRIGAGIHLSANVMLVMRRLGIERALSDIGLHPDAFVSRQWDTGETLFELPLDPAAEAHYGAAYINVHRGDLHAVLESSLEHGSIAFGKRLVAIKPLAHGNRLIFADGETVNADIVIGADGVRSVVRDAVAGPASPRFTGHVAHRSVFPAALLNGLSIRTCTKWWGRDKHILVYYMTQTREEVYVVTSVPQSAWSEATSFVDCDRDEFVSLFDGYHPELRQVVEAAPGITKWPVFDGELLPAWHRGPIVLLGDACHAMRPYMAAGAAMAIEDAAVLSRCIADIGTGDPEPSFVAYQATRLPRVAKVKAISEENSWLRMPVDPTWLFAYDARQAPLVIGKA